MRPSLTPSQGSKEKAKLVFAHFMISYSHPWSPRQPLVARRCPIEKEALGTEEIIPIKTRI